MDISKNLKKNILYYSFFGLVNYIVYIITISFAAFIYFILDHNLGDIDTWIGQNSWELVILSKAIALGVTLKIVNLNNNLSTKVFIKDNLIRPTQTVVTTSIFLAITFYALINEYTVKVLPVDILSNFSMQSAFGSFLFYMIDFFLIVYLLKFFPIIRRRNNILFITFSMAIFLICAKLTIPYLNRFILFVVLNLVFLTLIALRSKKSLSDCAVYSIIIIAPLSSIYGLDLILGDNLSLYQKAADLPYLGICLTWIISYLYYFRRV